MKSILSSIRLAVRKAKFYKGKSLFMIIPIGLMLALLVIASSEASNLIEVARQSIFSTLASQNEVIELSKNSFSQLRNQAGGGGGFQVFSQSSTDNTYTQTDADTVQSIANVDQATLISKLPLNNVKVSDLLSSSFNITNLAGLDSQYANIYTNEDFSYTQGEAIPIILNANDFKETYQDWQGKDEIDVDFSQLRQGFTRGANNSTSTPPANPADQSPTKTRSLNYDVNNLIGKEITVTIGGLDAINPVKQQSTSTGFKYIKKTDADIQAEVDARKSAIAQYWNYDQISTPLTYKFKVVGVIEGTDKTYAYVPSAFAGKVMQDYLNNELKARNSTAIPTSDYNSTFQGLIYDGVNLKDDATSGFLSGIRRQVSGQAGNFTRGAAGSSPTFSISLPDQSTSYKIPGLVWSEDRTTNDISGEYKSFDLSQALPLLSDTMLVKIDSINNRTAVIAALNDKGYTYTDFSNFESFDKLESYLHTALNVVTAIFMVVTALFILLNMARFVSDSRKEIGIFRAIGATKMRIRLIFIIQAFFYILVSMIVGVVGGIIGIVALSGLMQSSAQTFINNAVGGVIKLSANITTANFIRIDAVTIAIYLVILLIVTLLASLWPAEQAAKVSPVEAIRN